MRIRLGVCIAALALVAAGCAGDNSDGSETDAPQSGSIGRDEVNRYELAFNGGITMEHTGGLICKVEDGDLVMDFSIDASDGVYDYEASVAMFDPTQTQFNAEFDLMSSGVLLAAGVIGITFDYGPAPDEYPGVVRAAGTIDGGLEGAGDSAAVSGSYACFLMESEVGL